MSMYAYDAGSRYLVKAGNVDAAYKWLEEHGEHARRVGLHKDCIVLSADGREDMFCGMVSYSIGELIADFMKKFCEPGSYACHHIDEYNEYVLYWMDDEHVVHDESKVLDNPFAEKMKELEG